MSVKQGLTILLLRRFVFRMVEASASDWWWTARDHGKTTTRYEAGTESKCIFVQWTFLYWLNLQGLIFSADAVIKLFLPSEGMLIFMLYGWIKFRVFDLPTRRTNRHLHCHHRAWVLLVLRFLCLYLLFRIRLDDCIYTMKDKFTNLLFCP